MLEGSHAWSGLTRGGMVAAEAPEENNISSTIAPGDFLTVTWNGVG